MFHHAKGAYWSKFICGSPGGTHIRYTGMCRPNGLFFHKALDIDMGLLFRGKKSLDISNMQTPKNLEKVAYFEKNP